MYGVSDPDIGMHKRANMSHKCFNRQILSVNGIKIFFGEKASEVFGMKRLKDNDYTCN